jgi:hypothetical protein
MVILAGVVIVKETMFRFGHHVGSQVESLAVKADAWHYRRDATTSAFALSALASFYGRVQFGISRRLGHARRIRRDSLNPYQQLRRAINDLSDAAPPESACLKPLCMV